MSAHDKVANKEYPLQSVASRKFDDSADNMEDQALRVVYIEKKSDPLVYKTLWTLNTVTQFTPIFFFIDTMISEEVGHTSS